MAKIFEKEQAQKMRVQGESIGAIAKKLSVSKSTVSGWCRDIILPEKAILRIAKNGKARSIVGLMRYSESLRLKRLKDIQASMKEGKRRLGKLSDRDVYCIGLGLYWGEGYKQGSQEFGFTNSDPHMIAFYIRWLQLVFDVHSKNLILRVSINELHKKRIGMIEKYWSEKTQVPLSQFTKPSFIKTRSKKVYSNAREHMGTLRVKVRRGTTMRREVIGAIKSIDV